MSKLNLKFYKGKDLYSDGDIENTILEIVKNNTNFMDIVCNTKEWAVFYHLSPIRLNLLSWYDFQPNKTLLEIGAGCGALSGMFCKKLKKVTVVELSKRRANIIYHRHKKHNNLEIMAGNFNDMKFKEKYDYVTLIGVFEYAGVFTKGDTPFKTFLNSIRNHLKVKGKILIAIENKFGIKYFAGAKEDHTGRFFDSIEGYPKDKSVQTFGRLELQNLVKEAGFKSVNFYYPMPDYKLPNVIYSDEYLPQNNDVFEAVSPNFDQDRLSLFNENLVLKNVIKNKQFPFFANSFLVEACL